jgi:polyisoprenoid-binding protein YceI
MMLRKTRNAANQLAGSVLGAALATTALAADSYTIDPQHTYPHFEASHHGFSTHRGRFNKTSGKIVLDRDAGAGSVDIVIDATSLDTGLELMEKVLKDENYFNVAVHPTMAFRSDRLRFEGEKLVAADGQLTLLGVTRPVSLAVTHFKCGLNPVRKREACGADAAASIRRSEFGMKGGLPGVGDDVQLLIQVEAFKD